MELDQSGRQPAVKPVNQGPQNNAYDAAAQRFAVGRSTAYRSVAMARDEGRREAKPMHGGPAPRITGAAEATMLDLAGSPKHLTLAEITSRLAEAHEAHVHLTTVHRALRRAGWT